MAVDDDEDMDEENVYTTDPRDGAVAKVVLQWKNRVGKSRSDVACRSLFQQWSMEVLLISYARVSAGEGADAKAEMATIELEPAAVPVFKKLLRIEKMVSLLTDATDSIRSQIYADEKDHMYRQEGQPAQKGSCLV